MVLSPSTAKDNEEAKEFATEIKDQKRTFLVDPTLDEQFIYNNHICVLVSRIGRETPIAEIIKTTSDEARTFNSKITPLEAKSSAYTMSLAEVREAIVIG